MIFGISKSSRHWIGVALSFTLDMLFVCVAFAAGMMFRFGIDEPADLLGYLPGYLPGIVLASLVVPSVLYVGGLYAPRLPQGGLPTQLRWLLAAWTLGGLVALAAGSVDFSSRIGRGVLVMSFGFVILLTLAHHALLFLRRRQRWEVALCLVANEQDEVAATLLNCLWGRHAKVLGVVTANGYFPRSDFPILGDIDEISNAPDGVRVDLLLVPDGHLADPAFSPLLRRMRYQGVEVVSLADACEDAYQAVPLELVTEGWLFRASGQNGPLYVRKLKRLFDIVTSFGLLILLSPALLFGYLLVLVSSPGPVLFRQVRCGRLGRPFTILKLRSMRTDSEKHGPRWSSERDNRVFPAGRFLRKFRIDEIPQLWNILRGDMSFVGPRPERPEFVEELARDIPAYRERLLVQPGLTGWAQVRYPYGSSVEDTKRKLEYDLYYMKHMSLLLDGFIVLETIRTVIFGGVRSKSLEDYARFRQTLVARPAAEAPSPLLHRSVSL